MFLLTISFTLAAPSKASVATFISNRGVINYSISSNPMWVPSSAILLWSTEWNNLQVTIPHEFINTEGVSIENGMLKLEGSLSTQVPARRPRIYLKNFPYSEYWMKAVFMIPSSNHVQKWLNFFEPLSEMPTPYMDSQLIFDGQDQSIAITYCDVTNSGRQLYEIYEQRVATVEYDVPFEVIVHIKIHRTDGIIEYWIDETKVFEYRGRTLWDEYFGKSEAYNYPVIADCYMDSNEPTKILYQDGFKIYVMG
jgi:hypothetical protein